MKLTREVEEQKSLLEGSDNSSLQFWKDNFGKEKVIFDFDKEVDTSYVSAPKEIRKKAEIVQVNKQPSSSIINSP
jgi:hypothetical protein